MWPTIGKVHLRNYLKVVGRNNLPHNCNGKLLEL